MGIAVPEDFRREMAMAGDWQTVAEQTIFDHVKKEDGLEEFKNFVPDHTLNVGVRKRKFEGQGEEEDAGVKIVSKGWGSTVRHYPASDGDDRADLESLLNNTAPSRQEENGINLPESLLQPKAENPTTTKDRAALESVPNCPSIKKEESDHTDLGRLQHRDEDASSKITVKREDDDDQAPVVFKKRKSKAPGKS